MNQRDQTKQNLIKVDAPAIYVACIPTNVQKKQIQYAKKKCIITKIKKE